MQEPEQTTSEAQGMCDNKRSIIDQIIAENATRPGAMMVVLNETQSKVGYISAAMQTYIARKLHQPVSAVQGGEPVRNGDGGPALHQVLQRLLYFLLGLGIDRGGSLVKNQQARIDQ